MSQITQLGSGAIWICNKCQTWWGSQIGKRPSTNFLMMLDKAGLLPPGKATVAGNWWRNKRQFVWTAVTTSRYQPCSQIKRVMPPGRG